MGLRIQALLKINITLAYILIRSSLDMYMGRAKLVF